MSGYDDDQDVSGNELHDIVTMAMARRSLRSLVPDAPPVPSEQLTLVLRDGLPAATIHGSRLGRITSRVASLGLAAKLMLAAGVAVASAGSAATAVVFTHDNGHHGDGTDSPRNHPVVAVPSPTSTERGNADAEPTMHPTTIGGDERHDSGSGTDDSRSGSGDSGSGDSGSRDSGSGGSGSGDSGSSGSGDTGSSSSGSGDSGTSGSTGSGDSSGSSGSGSGSTSDGDPSGSTSGSTGSSGSGSSDGGGDPSPTPSPTSDS